jgi:hypothetical protein
MKYNPNKVNGYLGIVFIIGFYFNPTILNAFFAIWGLLMIASLGFEKN